MFAEVNRFIFDKTPNHQPTTVAMPCAVFVGGRRRLRAFTGFLYPGKGFRNAQGTGQFRQCGFELFNFTVNIPFIR